MAATALRLAREAKRLKRYIVAGVEVGFGRYIAELSTLQAVELGGIAKFAKAIGMNYATMRKHRSRYLESGSKRRYVRNVTPVTIPMLENNGGSHEPGPVKDSVTLTGEDARLWRKLKPRLKLLEHENRELRRKALDTCPHCEAALH